MPKNVGKVFIIVSLIYVSCKRKISPIVIKVYLGYIKVSFREKVLSSLVFS